MEEPDPSPAQDQRRQELKEPSPISLRPQQQMTQDEQQQMTQKELQQMTQPQQEQPQPTNHSQWKPPVESVQFSYEGGMFLIGKVENTPCELLVDTGCTCTLLSARIFNQMSPDERPDLQPYPGTLLSANGQPIRTLGETFLNITIGKHQMRQRAIVCEITNDGLLGLDFLKTHHVLIDFAQQKVLHDGEILPAKCVQGNSRACRVYLAEQTVIPAASRTLVQAKSQNHWPQVIGSPSL